MIEDHGLQELLNLAWKMAIDGGRYRDNAMAHPALVTAGPDVRVISLRKAIREERALYFHGDLRSKKVAQIRSNPHTIWHTWDREQHLQLHFAGNTTIHTNDKIAQSLWEEESLDELVFYFKADPPGTLSERPTSGLDLDKINEDEARRHFAAFRTEVEEILIHQLRPEEEIRARFFFDGAEFHGHWLVP